MNTPLPAPTLHDLTSPDDPLLLEVARLLAGTFADPDVVLDLGRLREFLTESVDGAGHDGAGRTTRTPRAPRAQRRFHVVAAVTQSPRGSSHTLDVVGTTIFSYVPASRCGFSEYIVVAPRARGLGLARQLFQRRKDVLDADAQRDGDSACRGLFIETESPERTPPDILVAEADSAMDAQARLRFFHYLGFRRTDVPYVQPPLAPGKQAVPYLDLLFLPWDQRAALARAIPAAWVLDTIRPVWQRWAPEAHAAPYETLRQQLRDRAVQLTPVVTEEVPGGP